MTHREMLEKGLPDTFDNSMRKWRSCPRKSYWTRRGFTYAGKPAYFAFGSAWGATQAAWYSQASSDKPTAERALNALQIGLKNWDASAAEGARNDTRENLVRLWGLYTDMYPEEPWEMVASEMGWQYPLRDSGYMLGGAIDGYISWPPFGMLVLETKTSGVWLGDQYLRQWSFSQQVTGYIWYLTQLLGEEQVFGCLMNLACKQISKAGKTPQFNRKLEKRSTEELEEFERSWISDIEVLEKYYSEEFFPKTDNPINCAGGIGKSACLFQPLCLSSIPLEELDPLQFESIVLQKEEWEPWKREGKEEEEGNDKRNESPLV